MNLTPNSPIFEEFEPENPTSAAFDEPVSPPADPPVEDPTQLTPGEEPPAEPQQPTAQVDAVQLAQALLERQSAQAAPPAAQPLTPEQVNERLRVVNLSEDDLASFFDPDADMASRVSAFQAILDRVSLHAQTLAEFSTQAAYQELQGQMAPLIQARHEQAQKDFVGNVSKEFPALGQFTPLIEQTMQQMLQSGYRHAPGPDGYKQALRDVAAQVGQIISTAQGKAFDINAKPASGNQPSNPHQLHGGVPRAGGSGAATGDNSGQDVPEWRKALGF